MSQVQKNLIISINVDPLDSTIHPSQLMRPCYGSERHIGPILVHTGSLLKRLIKGDQLVIRHELTFPLAAQ